MFPVLAWPEKTVVTQTLFGELKMVKISFFETLDGFAKCSPGLELLSWKFCMRWGKVLDFFPVTRAHEDYTFSSLGGQLAEL